MTSGVVVVQGDLPENYLPLLREAGLVAWDIETSGLNWQEERIGTCQLHTELTGSIIVQIGEEVPSRLCQILADPDVTKLFHHAMFDLRFMVKAWNVRPASIECTKVASKLLWPAGGSGRHSLQGLLRYILGKEIGKGQRLTDWMSEYLTEAQIEYATGDVKYLKDLRNVLLCKLSEEGRLHLYDKCVAFLPVRVELDLGEWPDVFTY